MLIWLLRNHPIEARIQMGNLVIAVLAGFGDVGNQSVSKLAGVSLRT
jgi:hypothetical protein